MAVSAYTGPDNLSSWREILTIKTTLKFSIRICSHLQITCLGIESTRLYTRMTMPLYIEHVDMVGRSRDQQDTMARSDLNLIENLWNDIGMAIMRDCSVTKRHLTQCILATWATSLLIG